MKKIQTIVHIEHPDFNVNVGTFDKKNPSVIFVEGTAYIKPKNDENYQDLLNKTSRDLSKIVKSMIRDTKMFYSSFISVVDFPYERMRPEKSSYLTFEYHLLQKNPKEVIKLSEEKNRFVINVLDNFISSMNENGLEVSKTK